MHWHVCVHVARVLNVIVVLLPYSDQAEARRTKVKEARKRRDERQVTKKQDVLKMYAKEEETPVPAATTASKK